MTNTTLGFPYPAATDPPAGHTQIQALADAVDLQPGVGSFTQAQITAFTAGEKRAGRIVWNSTTGTLQRCDGSAFVDVVLASGAQTLASKTLTTPTIGSMVNANHDHSAGAGGGLIPESSVTNLVSDLAAKLTTPGAWTAYTPTFTACSGTPTTVSGAARWTKVGRIVTVAGYVSITNKGTAAGALNVSLPTPSSGSIGGYNVGSAFEHNVGAGMGYIGVTGGQSIALMSKSAGTTWWVDNYTISFTVSYESAA